MTESTDRDLALVRRVRAGEMAACETFLRRVTNVVRYRVARVLSAAARGQPRASLRRQDLLDVMQDVFVVLMDRGARVLAAWDPARGLTLESFVGLVAEREALAFRRSGRRSAWAEQPSDDLACDLHDLGSPEDCTAAKEQLGLLFEYLSEHLSPQGALVFEALYVAETPVEEICSRFAMTPVAVYSFKTRLKHLVSHFRRGVEIPSRRVGSIRRLQPNLAPEGTE